MKAGEPLVIDTEAFAEAGAILSNFNGEEEVDLTPCSKVATVLDIIRKADGFKRLNSAEQARLRAAAVNVSSRLEKDDTRVLNFLNEAFGATLRPAKAEPARRTRVGTFLLKVADAS